MLPLRIPWPSVLGLLPHEQGAPVVFMAATALPSVAEHSDVLVALLAGAAAIIQALLYKRACSIDEKIKELMEQVYGEEGLIVRLAIVEHDCKRNHSGDRSAV